MKTASPEPAESPKSAQEDGKSVYGIPGEVLEGIERCSTKHELIQFYKGLPEALKNSNELLEVFSAKKASLQTLEAEAQQ